MGEVDESGLGFEFKVLGSCLDRGGVNLLDAWCGVD